MQPIHYYLIITGLVILLTFLTGNGLKKRGFPYSRPSLLAHDTLVGAFIIVITRLFYEYYIDTDGLIKIFFMVFMIILLAILTYSGIKLSYSENNNKLFKSIHKVSSILIKLTVILLVYLVLF